MKLIVNCVGEKRETQKTVIAVVIEYGTTAININLKNETINSGK